MTYDAKGNLTTNTNGQTYTWDFDNKLKSATVPVGGANGIEGTHSYGYDALARRVSKTVDGDTTVFGLSGEQVVTEYAMGNVPTNPNQTFVSASYVDEPVIKDDGAGILYYHANSLYSIAALTDAAKAAMERYGYEPYGGLIIFSADTGASLGAPLTESALGNTYTFTGRCFEEETGQYFFRARLVSSEVGRFATRDPIGYRDGLNMYAAYFVPNATDPSGLGTECAGPPAPGEVRHVGGRGSFTQAKLFAKHAPNKVGSTFWAFWSTPKNPQLFVDDSGCCCCDEVGVVQTYREESRYTPFNLPFTRGSGVDVGLLRGAFTPANVVYKYSRSTEPCKTGGVGQNYVVGTEDEPYTSINVPFFHTLIYAKLTLETCIVCLSGNEAGNGGLTTYGCITWGHEFLLPNVFPGVKAKREDYWTRRWIGGQAGPSNGYSDATVELDEGQIPSAGPSQAFSQSVLGALNSGNEVTSILPPG
jgi:RHS repeat-associated protein